MKRTTLQVGAYAVNCSILAEGEHCWIVDPGQEPERILAVLREQALAPVGILLTHAHFDHIGAIPALQKAYPQLPVFVHPADVPAFGHPMNRCEPDYPPIAAPQNVRDVTNRLLWPTAITPPTVIETPGHTPGGVCYYFENERLLLSGDTLFAGSIGRTDFPGGDMATLIQSLERLKRLPPDTNVIPGHGMFTTMACECAGNPFFEFKV